MNKTFGGGGVRLIADIIEPGKPVFRTFVEVENQYAKYLSNDRVDYLLLLVFTVAIREGYDVLCEAPVSEMLLHNIREILIPHYLIGDKNAKSFEIFAETVPDINEGIAVGTGMSCGVDSMFSLMKYTNSVYKSMNLTHLFVGSVNAELWDFDEKVDDLFSWEEKHKDAFDRIKTVSQMTGLPVVKMYTNVIWYVCKRDWTFYHHLFTHTYITLSAVLALRSMWRIFYFSSAWDLISKFNRTKWITRDPEDNTLMSLHVLSTSGFNLFSGGAECTREEKTRLLADYDIAKKVLHPCHKQGKMNCSDPWCGKCMRSFPVLDYYDKLDEMSEVFDIQRYKNNKSEYFWWLARYRDSETIAPAYELMVKKYPEEMKKITEQYDNWIKPIPRETYDILQFAYNVSMRLLGIDDLQGKLFRFFNERNISRLYCSGGSIFGNKIKSMIERNIECVTYQTGKFEECDAGLMLTFVGSERERIKNTLGDSKPIYTIEEIEKGISEMA